MARQIRLRGPCKDAPANGVIAAPEAWKKLWTAWRGGDPPAVDFATDLIVVATASGPNTVRIGVRLDDQGNATVLAMSTRMAGPGFGYALAQIKRARIKTIDGAPLPAPPATAPATQPATQPATPPAAASSPAAQKPLAFDTYAGYFVKNTFEPAAAASFVVLADQKSFDDVFGAGFVMNDRSHRLPAQAFDKYIVVAAIKRGKAMWDYKVQAVREAGGVVSLVYASTERAGGGAEFAVPLIVSLPKGDYRAVEWVETARRCAR